MRRCAAGTAGGVAGVDQRRRLLGLGAALLLAVPALRAEEVALAGRMGDRALLLIGGRTQVLGVGQAAGGVKLLRWEGESAVVEQDGATLRLRVGAAPARLAGQASTAGSREIVIPVGPGGHFIATGSINGRPIQFMVDTGATLVALPMAEAQRLGLDLSTARRVMTHTAAGPAPAFQTTLARLRLGEVEVFNVPALVTQASMPFVLLGNSFLNQFLMRRDADVMRLTLR